MINYRIRKTIPRKALVLPSNAQKVVHYKKKKTTTASIHFQIILISRYTRVYAFILFALIIIFKPEPVSSDVISRAVNSRTTRNRLTTSKNLSPFDKRFTDSRHRVRRYIICSRSGSPEHSCTKTYSFALCVHTAYTGKLFPKQ